MNRRVGAYYFALAAVAFPSVYGSAVCHVSSCVSRVPPTQSGGPETLDGNGNVAYPYLIYIR